MLKAINGWLNGKKTLIGGLGLVLAALAHFATNLGDGLQVSDIIVLAQEIGAGFAVLGIGHKISKIGE